jgi:recombinational DNA repair protein RecT
MAEKPKNQTQAEYFAVETTGRRGVEEMLMRMKDELTAVATPIVRKDFSTWMARALADISSRDELAPLIATRKGLYSIYRGLLKCVTMGLQIGGQFPHSYFMPKKGEGKLVITWEGYAFAAAYGPGAVLRYAPELMRVYDQDKIAIDQAQGVVAQHDINPFAPRGKLLGWYMRLEYIDGHVEIPFITSEKVDAINAAYSTKETSEGGKMPAWAKSPEEMRDKTAAKQLLKKPAKTAEGLAMALSADDPEEEPEPPAPPSPDIKKRVGPRLAGAADALDVEPIRDPEPPKKEAAPSKPAVAPEIEKPPKTPAAPQPEAASKSKKDDLDLF